MAEVPYKLYINTDPGRKSVDIYTGKLDSTNYGQVLPGTNTPYSYREATPEETAAYQKNKLTDYQKLGTSSGLIWGVDPASQETGWIRQGTEAGNPTTLANEAAVAAGTMKKVAVGNGFSYIPVGSPADLNLQGKDYTASSWTDPLTGKTTAAGTGIPEPIKGIQIENEADLQAKRQELKAAGIPQADWSKYISSPDSQGRLFYSQPATITSPSGEKKVVASGSPEASNLLSSGWTLGDKVGGGSVINTKLITPTEPINIGETTSSNTYNADTTTASASSTSKSTDELIKYYQTLLTAPESDLSKQISKLLGEISTGANSLTGKGAAQLAEEEKRGIEAKTTALTSANTQLKTKLAEIDALTKSYELANQTEEGKPQTLSRLQGAKAQNYKMYLAQKNGLSSEAGILQANILGLQGELQAAQAAADRAVNLAYADKESAYNAKLAQLQILQPQLEKEEKNYTTALQMVLQQQADALAEQKANQKLLLSSTLDTMAKYPDAGITVSDTPEVIQQKIKNSAIYREQVRPPQYASGGTGTTVSNPQVDSWVKLINSGQSKITSVPANLKNAVAMQLSAGQSASMTQSGYDVLSSVNSLLNSNTNAITGIGQSPLTMLGITNQSTINTYNQLKGLLALDNRQKLKGSGAISDFESRTLADASSRLSRTLSNSAFRQELSRIQGTLLTASGNEALVKITDPKTGESQEVMSTRAGIEAALQDGYDVQYK